MRTFAIALLALAVPVAADPFSAVEEFVDDNTPSCSYAADPEGRSGAGCRLARNCYSIVWGYHTEFLTVGGGSSCSGGAWVNPHAPADPLDLIRVCFGLTDSC